MMNAKTNINLVDLEVSLMQNGESDISKINITQSKTESTTTKTYSDNSIHNKIFLKDLSLVLMGNDDTANIDVFDEELLQDMISSQEESEEKIEYYDISEEELNEYARTEVHNSIETEVYKEITTEEENAVPITNKKEDTEEENRIVEEEIITTKEEKPIQQSSFIDTTKEKIIDMGKNINSQNIINAIDTVAISSAKGIKKVSDKLNVDNGKYKVDICQNFIPIKGFIGGMIVTADNRYVRIAEILPINFYDKAPTIADNIIHNFSRLFYSGLITHQFKVVCDKSNPYKLIDFIRNKNKKEKDEKVLAQVEDTISLIKEIAENGGLTKRFFVIYEYEGENGKRSTNLEEIYESMNHTQHHIVQAFNDMGNYVVIPDYQKESIFYSEILYYHFNKRAYRTESLDSRIIRLYNDKAKYNSITGEKKDITLSDVCSPKGISLKNKTYAKMDGSYYTYLALSDESYIRYVRAGWLDIFTQQNGFELDVYVKRLPKELTEIYMEQKIKFKRVDARRAITRNREKYEELSMELNDDYTIKGMLKSGDSLYNVCCIITIRADSYKELEAKKKIFTKSLKKEDITFEESYLNVEAYMLMTMPLLMINNAIFSRNAHNFTTTQLASLYMFTAYELYDTQGFLLGLNEKNNTIASINHFNTQKYRNANMLILGTSGAGKTFTEMTLGWRMRIAGIRVFYILPVKGYEYKKMCDEIGGQYIKLAPSLKNCINIFEVRPETAIDKNALEEGVIFEQTSWLAKTMITATTFISLLLHRDLLPKENSKLSVAMKKMYSDFGITDDNESIYIDGTRKIKTMPVPSDLIPYIDKDEVMSDILDILEEFRTGSLQNFNHQTNVNLSNPFTVLDVDENDIGERYAPAFLFLATIIVYAICKQNRLLFKAIFMDEVWKALINELSAKQIQQMIKLVRGYGASAILATQDIEDFAGTKFGSSCISNTQIKFFLKMEEAEIREVSKYITLSDNDCNSIMNFQRGHGLLIANNDKTNIHVISSRKELEAFTTDTNILRQIHNVSDY